jgi:hypothetical protein
MHTGLEEVVNLAWKLAAVLKAGAGRRCSVIRGRAAAVAVRNVQLSTQTYNALSIRSWPGQGLSAWDRTWFSIPEHFKLQYCYERSPICIPDNTAPVPDTPSYVPSTRPGTRAPHAWLADGRSTIDLFGGGFVLLRLGASPPVAAPLLAAARARSMPLAQVAIADLDIATLYERKLVLVRPDGHVAWRGDECLADAGAIIANPWRAEMPPAARPRQPVAFASRRVSESPAARDGTRARAA